MNTTAAALQANVTAATIRTWCRRGAVTAIKQAGRWIIDNVSLTARITISAWKRPARKETPVINLNARYTWTGAGATQPTTVTPTVKRRTTPHAGNIIKISGLTALFADRFDAIADSNDRVHALTLFAGASIVISDTADSDWDDDPYSRESGQLRTTYRGDLPQITVADVLDVAAQLRTQLA
jgi:hypothetical protein